MSFSAHGSLVNKWLADDHSLTHPQRFVDGTEKSRHAYEASVSEKDSIALSKGARNNLRNLKVVGTGCSPLHCHGRSNCSKCLATTGHGSLRKCLCASLPVTCVPVNDLFSPQDAKEVQQGQVKDAEASSVGSHSKDNDASSAGGNSQSSMGSGAEMSVQRRRSRRLR